MFQRLFIQRTEAYVYRKVDVNSFKIEFCGIGLGLLTTTLVELTYCQKLL